MSDLISIIVPVYNVETYIERCVESIVKQTYRNLEIILVDDGSTDSSTYLCDKIKEYDSRIIVIHQTNSGLSEARNIGIKQAKGSFIGFVDGDDYIEKDMFETLYQLIKNNEADISMVSYWNDYGNELIARSDTKERVVFNKIEALKELFLGERICDKIWNKLYKKELFKGVKFPKNRNYEDIETSFKLLENANRVALYDIPKYHYIKRNNSIVSTFDDKNCIDFLNAIYNRYIYSKDKYKNIEEYISLNYVKGMIWVYPIIATFDLVDAYEIYEKNYTILKSIISTNEKSVIDKLDNYKKAILYLILLDKEKNKNLIKELYLLYNERT